MTFDTETPAKRPSVLHQLRQLLPTDRPVTDTEARAIAERQAYRLLNLLGVTRPSVDVGKIAELPRIEVRVASKLPVSGLTYWHKNRWLITVKTTDAPTRRRFTLAHEFKHVIDHPVIDTLYPDAATSDQTARRIEAICDHFAACLLMPGLWVKRAWLAGTRDIDALSRLFNVSPAAMRIRINILGLYDKAGSHTGDVRHYFRPPAMAYARCATTTSAI
jgi:hypothetical protein